MTSHVFAETSHVVAAPHGSACVVIPATFIVSSKSVQGIRSHRSKFGHSHYSFDYWLLQQLVVTHKPWLKQIGLSCQLTVWLWQRGRCMPSCCQVSNYRWWTRWKRVSFALITASQARSCCPITIRSRTSNRPCRFDTNHRQYRPSWRNVRRHWNGYK